MNTKTKILTSFARYNDPELEQKALLIADHLTGNEGFPSPQPSLAELNAAAAAFGAAITKAKDGTPQDRAAKDAARETLSGTLDRLALYVQMTGNGNDALLASSGFSLSKTPAPIGMLDKPHNFSVQPTNPGMVRLSMKAVHGAKSYQYEYRKAADEHWTVKVHTQSNLLVTGLTSGQQYQFRVAGVGTDPERVYSDVISSFVL